MAGTGNQVNNRFLLCFFIYILLAAKLCLLKKNLVYEHTSLLQLKNPKLNKNTNIKSSITGYYCLKGYIKRIKCYSVGSQLPHVRNHNIFQIKNMTHLPYWIDIYFRTCHVEIKQKSQPLPLTRILYYKSTLQLHPIFEYKLLVCGLMIILKHFSIQTHYPSALWILEGDNKWEVEEDEEREGNKFSQLRVLLQWGDEEVWRYFCCLFIFILC